MKKQVRGIKGGGQMKRITKFFILAISMFSIVGTSVTAISNIQTEDYVFETTNKEFSHRFADVKETKNGTEYLQNVEYTVISSAPVLEDQEVTYEVKQENLYSKEEFQPEQSIITERDGQEITMTLDNIEYVPMMIENRTHEVTGYTDFGYKTTKPTPDETKTVDYYDEITGQTVSAALPLTSLELEDDWEWKSDVEVPITFHFYDSEYYQLGDILIPYNADKPALQGNEEELLNVLGLDSKSYQITDFNWNGQETKSNDGSLYRNAIAIGNRYVANYVAYYGDRVSLPDAPGYTAIAHYKATIQVPTGETQYQVKATAYYKVKNGFFVPILIGITAGAVGIFLIAWFTLNNVLIYRDGHLIGRTRVRRGKINIKSFRKRIQNSGSLVIKRRYVMRHAGNTVSILLGNQPIKEIILPVSHEDFKTTFTI